MCGIVGIVTQGIIDRSQLVEAMDSLKHRGPDGSGIWIDENQQVGLAHRRLSIIDLSERGIQPMSNEDKSIWITYNGEIYNFIEIKKELIARGHIFTSNTDTEVIIHAYEEWGIACLEKFIGMFAFGLWDKKEKKLILARDRLGIKPLYYYKDNEKLIFASEIKAIKCFRDVDLKIDKTAIYDFMTYLYIPTPKSIYAKVKKLPAGHYLVMKDNRTEVHMYWDLNVGNYNITKETEAIEKISELIKSAVKYRLVSDVPVGILLSGGLDSSAITAFTSKVATNSPKVFSVGFDVAEYDEIESARVVAQRYNLNFYTEKVKLEDATTLFDTVAINFDEPFGDSSLLPTYVVSKIAAKNVKVVLCGDGGDEIFGGYQWYTNYLRFCRRLPIRFSFMKKFAIDFYPSNLRGRMRIASTGMNKFELYTKLHGGLIKEEKKNIMNEDFFSEFREYDDYWLFRKYWKKELDIWTALQYLDIKTYLCDDILVKVDRMSMLNSLESRVPLLDHRLVQLLFEIDPKVRNKCNEKKYIFKKVISPYLPEEILRRKKKGFSSPINQWMEAGWLTNNSIPSFLNQNKFSKTFSENRTKFIAHILSLFIN